MRYARTASVLLVLCLCQLLLPQRSVGQTEESVPITYTQYTRVVKSGIWTNCHSQMVGSHDDPVGNGRDSDYTVRPSNGKNGNTPSDWTGQAEDIPGVRITFFGGYRSSSSPREDASCTDTFNGHAAAWAGFTARAYFTPPPNDPPSACFTYRRESGLRTVTFDAFCSNDSDGQINSYNWDLGDGKSGSGISLQHTYDELGEYQVSLTVRDDDGDEDTASKNVDVEGPDLRYVVRLGQQQAGASKRSQEDDPAFQVGDTVRVEIAVENTSDWGLEEIRLLQGDETISVTPDSLIAFVRVEQEAIASLEGSEADTLVYLYEAQVTGDFTVLVGGVMAEAVQPGTSEKITYSETETACIIAEKKGTLQEGGKNISCAKGSATGHFVVNTTGDDPLGTDNEGNSLTRCDTGGEQVTMRDGTKRAACTLRAAIELANAGEIKGAIEIAFDIPEEAPVIEIEEPIEVTIKLSIDGTTQQGATPDGEPVIEVSGASSGALDKTDGLVLKAQGVEVRGLKFTRFGTAVVAEAGDAVIEGNYLGSAQRTEIEGGATNVTGVYVTNAPGVVIRDNLISGNGWGVRIEGASEGTTVEDNRIGTHADGLGRSLNNVGILILDAPGNIIRNNLISGNRLNSLDEVDDPRLTVGSDFAGLRIEGTGASGNSVEGNRFGLTPDGNDTNLNGIDIYITRAPGNTIGGSGAARNYFARGVAIVYEEAIANRIIGNYFGVNEAGTEKLWGGGYLSISANGTWISDNLFAGGISVGADNTKILGNTIRIQANGIDALIDNTHFYNTSGIHINGVGNKIIDNKIGHGLTGIRLESSGEDNRAEHTLIEGNEIFNNRLNGIYMEEDRLEDTLFPDRTGARFNTIRANAIYNNGRRGIKIANMSHANDLFDRDSGANDRQNHPEFYVAELDGESLRAEGELRTPPGSGQVYIVDFYANRFCNLSHEGTVESEPYGEGERHLGSLEVTSAALGTASFSWAITPWPKDHFVLTATATNPDGSTSEFSRCHYVSDRVAEANFDPQTTGPAMDEAGIQVTVAGPAGTTTALDTATLYASRYEAQPERNVFSGAALSNSGLDILPEHVRNRSYHLAATGLLDAEGNPVPVTYDLCLDATGQASEEGFEQILLLQRHEASNHVWIPHDTHIKREGDATYACAVGLTAFGEFGFGSGNEAVLAAPVLRTPEDDATHVLLGTALTWQTIPEANTYDLQVALDAGFTALLADTTALPSATVTPDSLALSQVHYWRVRGVTASGEAGPWSAPFRFTTGATGVAVENEAGVPESFVLEVNYPNPFNPQTTIGFALPEASEVRLAVYDMLGRRVALLVEGTLSAGRHQALFDAKGLPSGVYLYRLQADRFTKTRRMLLLK